MIMFQMTKYRSSGVERVMIDTLYKSTLRWFDYMERMNEKWLCIGYIVDKYGKGGWGGRDRERKRKSM